MVFSFLIYTALARFLVNDYLFHHSVLGFNQRPMTYQYMKKRVKMLHTLLTFLILWLLLVVMIQTSALFVSAKFCEHFYSRRIGSWYQCCVRWSSVNAS
jgi:hypothetical protein